MSLTISALRQALLDPLNTIGRESIRGQITELSAKETKDGKPYWRFTLADGTGEMEVNVWNDHAAYRFVEDAWLRRFIAVEGMFKLGKYGLEAVKWGHRFLEDAEIEALLQGSPEGAAEILSNLDTIKMLVSGLSDPVLKLLSELFLQRHGEAFKRAAAARGNHHARRGGLVEHTASMMRAADLVARNYPQINRDLLICGALFHDCGKMVENQYEERGFLMPFTAKAELFGHISIGVEIVRGLWRHIGEMNQTSLDAAGLTDYMANYPVRSHTVNCLCHLILSHHGELAWGSPVEPKLPEAALLHYLDQIDAKLEMMKQGFANSPEIGEGVVERVYPMKVNLVKGVL